MAPDWRSPDRGGSTLGFWCSAYQVPNTAIIGLRNVLLGGQLSDAEYYDLRFVIDGQRYDLRGIAKEGELMISPADANMEYQVSRLIEALIAGKEAQIAVPCERLALKAAAGRRRRGAGRRVRGLPIRRPS